jgi:hypothetical protein
MSDHRLGIVSRTSDGFADRTVESSNWHEEARQPKFLIWMWPFAVPLTGNLNPLSAKPSSRQFND